MPTYCYQCESCKAETEKVLRMSERKTPLESPCESCGEMALKQVIQNVGGFGKQDWKNEIPSDFKWAMRQMKKRHPKSNIPEY